MNEAVEELGRGARASQPSASPSWGQEPGLIEAYATAIAESLAAIDPSAQTTLVLTAHSLPVAAVRAGDPYEREVRAAAAKIGERASRPLARESCGKRSCSRARG